MSQFSTNDSSLSPDPMEQGYSTIPTPAKEVQVPEAELTIPQLEEIVRTKRKQIAANKRKISKIDVMLTEIRAKRERLDEARRIQNLEPFEIAQCFSNIGPFVKQINFLCAVPNGRMKLVESINNALEEVGLSVKYYNAIGVGAGSGLGSSNKGVYNYTAQRSTTASPVIGIEEEYIPFPVVGRGGTGAMDGKSPGGYSTESGSTIGTVTDTLSQICPNEDNIRINGDYGVESEMDTVVKQKVSITGKGADADGDGNPVPIPVSEEDDDVVILL